MTLDNDDCRYQIFYDIMVDTNTNNVSINASIWVCLMVDQEELMQDLRRHLRNDLILFMNDNNAVQINNIYLVEFEGLYIIDTTSAPTSFPSATFNIPKGGKKDGGSHKDMLLYIIIAFIVSMVLLAMGFVCYYWRKMGSELDKPSSIFDFNFGSNSTTNDGEQGTKNRKNKWNKRKKNKSEGLVVPNNNNRMLSIQSQSSMDMSDNSMDGIMSNMSNERSKSNNMRETNTRGDFQQNVGDHALGTEMVMSDIVNEMDETPQ